jgi:hypothetical protein
VACPNDGEPLSINVNGVVFCRYDNWRPPGQARSREALNAQYAG